MLVPLIFDVRTPTEHAAGHLPDSILLPTEPPPAADWTLTQRYLDAIMGGKSFDTPIYLYCRKGKRSGTAAEMLRRMGFRNVSDMGGVEEGALAAELRSGHRTLVR